jgi:hypothetical protein
MEAQGRCDMASFDPWPARRVRFGARPALLAWSNPFVSKKKGHLWLKKTFLVVPFHLRSHSEKNSHTENKANTLRSVQRIAKEICRFNFLGEFSLCRCSEWKSNATSTNYFFTRSSYQRGFPPTHRALPIRWQSLISAAFAKKSMNVFRFLKHYPSFAKRSLNVTLHSQKVLQNC